MKRTDVEIPVEDAVLAGWYYEPTSPGRTPLIIMSHGFGAVRDMCIPRTAEVFAERGFAVLLYDHRSFGASGGEPRQEANPWRQAQDMRDVVSFARNLAATDPERIGLWGTSYSGAHALVVGAIDRRIKCVVAQVPMVSGWKTVQRTMSADQIEALRADCYADRDAVARGAPLRYVPISKPGTQSHDWSSKFSPNTPYRNEVTLRSWDMFFEYEPWPFIERIAPTPLLMILAENDTRTPTDDQLAAFAIAREPKKLYLFKGGHYDPYSSRLEETSAQACSWFAQHLMGIQLPASTCD